MGGRRIRFPGRVAGGAGAAGAPARTWAQRLVVAAGCLTVMGLVASAAALTYAYRKYERLPRVELSGVLDRDTASDQPENYLIVGVDNAAGLDPDDPVRRGRDTILRSDTIMIARIDPSTREASLLSLPRDLWLPIAGTGSSQRINTAIQRGGAELLVRTIGEYFGIPIHHYVQVDFASFRGLVDAVDGVPVYVEHPARDRASGLVLDGPGCVTLGPEQALAYVRSRHYQERIDGEWVTDRSSDLGRIDRQQDFIRRALRRAIDRGARNPRRMDALIDVALEGIVVDDSLDGADIFRLGNRFRSFQPEDLVTYSVPTTADTVGEAQILRLDADAAEPVLDVFRGGRGADTGSPGTDWERGGQSGESATLAPESVRLSVLNGSGEAGQAAAAAEALGGAGFTVSRVGEAASFDHGRTVVQHGPGQREEAGLVARFLTGGAELEEVDGGSGIVVVTGRDWRGVRSEPAPAGSEPEPEGGDSTTTSLLGADGLRTTTTRPDGGDGAATGGGSDAVEGVTSTTSAAAQGC